MLLKFTALNMFFILGPHGLTYFFSLIEHTHTHPLTHSHTHTYTFSRTPIFTYTHTHSHILTLTHVTYNKTFIATSVEPRIVLEGIQC